MAVIKTLQRVWGSFFYKNALYKLANIKTVSEKVIFQFTLNYLFDARKPVFYCKKIAKFVFELGYGSRGTMDP